MAEWFRGFFDGLYRHVLPKTFDRAATDEQARAVRRMLAIRKGAAVLDVPCGVGRLTIPLARMSLRMTGVDLNAGFIRRARRGAKRAVLDVRFVQSDMRRIDFDREFDAAFNWFGSFGYFSDADNLDFSRHVLTALKPGGRFLIEGLNKSWVLRHWRNEGEQTINHVRIHMSSRWHARTNRVHSTWTFCRRDEVERRRLDMRLFDAADLRTLLRQAGFREIRFFGRPPQPFGRFTRHSRRIIAVARRPL